jgi:subtilisin family serine protease
MAGSRHTAVACLALGLLAACSSDKAVAPSGTPSFARTKAAQSSATGQHIVQFKGDAVPADFAARVQKLGGEVVASYEGTGVAVVSGLSAQTAAQLASARDVSAVDVDEVVQIVEPVAVNDAVATDVPAASPDDPTTAFRYPRQWNMRAISAPTAWAAGKLGSPTVKVAILDTGLDYTNLDLAGRVDLTLSRSFVPSDDALVQQFFPGAHPIADLQYHGTHVGATVASNAILAAGVTSKTTLIGVKVLGVSGSGSFSGIFAGIRYAADVDADIINMSLGSFFERREAPGFVSVINRAINYAHRKGTLVVVSAGNDAIDLDHDGNGYKIFCSAPNVVCVSATGPTAAAGVNGPWENIDALASYSNYGRSAINVAAPGGNSGGAIWAACSKFSLVVPICRTGNFVLGLTGTSMASPHAAGVAALIAAEGAKGPAQLRARLQQTADDLGQPGTDPAYGKGRVNAARAAGVI